MRTEADGRRHKWNAASFEIFRDDSTAGGFRRMPNLQSTRVWQMLRRRRIHYTQDSAGALQFRLISGEAQMSKRGEDIAKLATRKTSQ
jgi:hypothetical protein